MTKKNHSSDPRVRRYETPYRVSQRQFRSLRSLVKIRSTRRQDRAANTWRCVFRVLVTQRSKNEAAVTVTSGVSGNLLHHSHNDHIGIAGVNLPCILLQAYTCWNGSIQEYTTLAIHRLPILDYSRTNKLWRAQ